MQPAHRHLQVVELRREGVLRREAVFDVHRHEALFGQLPGKPRRVLRRAPFPAAAMHHQHRRMPAGRLRAVDVRMQRLRPVVGGVNPVLDHRDVEIGQRRRLALRRAQMAHTAGDRQRAKKQQG